MKKMILTITLMAFASGAFATDCESKKVIFKGHFKIAGTTADGKKALFKEAWYPLIEDWSEASGEIQAVSVTGLSEAQVVQVEYTDKDKKKSNEAQYKIAKGKLVDFDWKKSVGPNAGRKGELTFKVLGKEKEAFCEKVVSIHYADQLDR